MLTASLSASAVLGAAVLTRAWLALLVLSALLALRSALLRRCAATLFRPTLLSVLTRLLRRSLLPVLGVPCTRGVPCTCGVLGMCGVPCCGAPRCGVLATRGVPCGCGVPCVPGVMRARDVVTVVGVPCVPTPLCVLGGAHRFAEGESAAATADGVSLFSSAALGAPAAGARGRVPGVPFHADGGDDTFCGGARERGVCAGSGDRGTAAAPSTAAGAVPAGIPTVFCDAARVPCAARASTVLLARSLRPGFAGSASALDILFLGMAVRLCRWWFGFDAQNA